MEVSLSSQPVKKGLSGNALKIIAIIAMTIDHVAWVLFPGYEMAPLTIVMHVIGRITAPIMMFFIAEGYVLIRKLQIRNDRFRQHRRLPSSYELYREDAEAAHK